MYSFQKVTNMLHGALHTDPAAEYLQFWHENFIRGDPARMGKIKRKQPKTPHATNRPPMQSPLHPHSSTTHPPPLINHPKSQPGLAMEPSLCHGDSGGNSESTFMDSTALEPSMALVHSQSPEPEPRHAMSACLLEELSSIKMSHSDMIDHTEKLAKENEVLWRTAMQQKTQVDKQQATVEKIMRFLASVFMPSESPAGQLHPAKSTRMLRQHDKKKTSAHGNTASFLCFLFFGGVFL